ncbi:MAG: hypothetical protein JSV61_02215 [Anaerolineales bacterium]|nr:MAG: hypothetical protein JSV61_02215 [Anaerolineales bacterium]
MILVRQVFQIKYGQMDKVLALLKAAEESMQGSSYISRVLTDISGKNFTLVLEIKAESMEAWWNTMQQNFQDPERRAQSDPLMEYVESGYKEFYTIEYEAEN